MIDEVIASKKDFRIETFRASGKGGQHRNKTDSAVRMTHIPSGISVTATENRCQHQNRREAFDKISELVIKWWKSQKAKLEIETAQEKGVVRTYNAKRNTVKDMRTGTTLKMDDVLDGEIDKFLNDLKYGTD